jgi:uncharacterized membrane protein
MGRRSPELAQAEALLDEVRALRAEARAAGRHTAVAQLMRQEADLVERIAGLRAAGKPATTKPGADSVPVLVAQLADVLASLPDDVYTRVLEQVRARRSA